MVRCGGGCRVSSSVGAGSVTGRGGVPGRSGVMCARCVLGGGFGLIIIIITAATATRTIIEAPINCNDAKAYIRKILEKANRKIYARHVIHISGKLGRADQVHKNT